jgi:hypothetical protein
VGHPKIYDDFQPARGVWGFFNEVFLKHGYNPMVYNVKISQDEIKYLYCLSLKTPAPKKPSQEDSAAGEQGEGK